LAFLGSPDFAVPSLRALHASGHEIVAVYSQPPKPAGRGQLLQRCAVHAAADTLGLAVRTPARLRGDLDEHKIFASLALDAAVVVAYGQILPQPMLDAPRRGCLNVHASLLPRWRGAGPIQAAILAGDTETGISLMQMDAGLDTGAVILSAAVPIGPETTASRLHDILAQLGSQMVLKVLDDETLAAHPQAAGATYAPKFTRDSGRLNWRLDAATLDRTVRALVPWPGTWTVCQGDTLKILEAAIEPGVGEPGQVLDHRLLVATGHGALRLVRVQRPGRAPMMAEEMLRGRPIAPGTYLG